MRNATIYDESIVEKLFIKSLKETKDLLAKVSVYSGREPSFSGLSGWVFEQTIQHCVRGELKQLQLTTEFEEQFSLGGRVKADLRIGRIAIEIKTAGLFNKDEAPKYKTYQTRAAEKGYRYIFLSIDETTYRTGIVEALGEENVFLLKQGDGVWKRLIETIADNLE